MHIAARPLSRLGQILACPVCQLRLEVTDTQARCHACGRIYTRLEESWVLLAHNGQDPSLPRHTAGRFQGRMRRLTGGIGRVYRRLYVHPARFLGDLQHTGLTNYHRRVARFLDSFPPEAFVLDVGSGIRRLRENVITLDIAQIPMVDILADAHHLPLGADTVDGIILQQVLEHVRDPHQIIGEVFRVLRPGGRFYCEVPFLYPVHNAYDFRRWTISGLELLCAQFTILDAGMCMGPLSAISAIARRMATAPLRSPYLEATVDLVLGWLLSPLKYLDEVAALWPATTLVAGAVYVEAQRPVV